MPVNLSHIQTLLHSHHLSAHRQTRKQQPNRVEDFGVDAPVLSSRNQNTTSRKKIPEHDSSMSLEVNLTEVLFFCFFFLFFLKLAENHASADKRS